MTTTTPSGKLSSAIQTGLNAYTSVSLPPLILIYPHMARFVLIRILAHCLDILRQRLMCSVDIGVFGAVWVQNGTHRRSFVDFNTKHVCRNFDAIRDWAAERQIPEVVPGGFLEQPGEGVTILDEFP